MEAPTPLRGLSVWLRVLGCRASLCEGEALAGELEARGAKIVDGDTAEAAVLVTCSVTAEADRKCRQLIRKARRVVGAKGIVAVCGCWAQGAAAASVRALGVDILAGSHRKSLIPAALERALEEGRSFQDLRVGADSREAQGWEEMPLRTPLLHTRAFMKIQEGCDRFCSYCIIPFLRGKPASRPLRNILEEAHRLVGEGCREIVLTGIHLGMYGRDLGVSLADVVRALSRMRGLDRLRLGSLEPFSLEDRLLEVLGDSPAFCPHLHLPMQSGDDAVLARMRRGYTADGFARICDAARARLGEGLHISSDIMVGFPGETEAAFHNTLDLMRRSGLGRVHVFPYSVRPGTVAARQEDAWGRVGKGVKAARAAEAAALGAELLEGYAGNFLGREVEVLSEGADRGHTPHFLEAVWKPEGTAANQLIRVKVHAASGGRLEGCPIPKGPPLESTWGRGTR